MHEYSNRCILVQIKMEELEGAIKELKRIEKKYGIDHTNGLPESLFEYATTLMPVANIDLLVTNKKGEVLLSWRDDRFYGSGWHIPGGCIRVREPIEMRIQKTAEQEIGCKVDYDKQPMVVRESFVDEDRPWLEDQLERSHNISLLYAAQVTDDYCIDNGEKTEHEAGFLKWFSRVPKDLLLAHQKLYGDILQNHFEKLGGNYND